MMRFANLKSKYRTVCYVVFTIYCIASVVNKTTIHVSRGQNIGDKLRSNDAVDKTEMGIYDNGTNGSNHEQQHAIHFAESHEQFEMLLRDAGISEEEGTAYRKSRREFQHFEGEKIHEGVDELVYVDEDFEKRIRDANTTMETILHQDSKIIQPNMEQQTSLATMNSTSPSAKGFLRSKSSAAADQSTVALAGLFATALVASIFTVLFVRNRKLFK